MANPTARVSNSIKSGTIVSYPVKNGVTIWDGSLVGIIRTGGAGITGRADNWTDPTVVETATTMKFLGVARVHNTEGSSGFDSVVGNSAGTVEVEVDISGALLENVPITLASDIDVGVLVYSADGNPASLTKTAPGTSNNAIGYVQRFITTTLGNVKLFSGDNFRTERTL
jgi:hypothetical protein